MSKIFFILLFLAFAAYGQQQERVAIINTMDNNDSIGFNELSHLTNRLRETAVKVLPNSRYGVMTTESIVAFLGSEEQAAKECREASCLAVLGRKVNADYVGQARIGRFGNQLSINFQLYNSKSGNLMDSFTGESKNLSGLLAIINDKALALFKKLPNEYENETLKNRGNAYADEGNYNRVVADYKPYYSTQPKKTTDYNSYYNCPNGSYKNSQGNTVCRPSANNAGGATAICRDGTYSYSQNRRGTCSGHGGVAQWL